MAHRLFFSRQKTVHNLLFNHSRNVFFRKSGFSPWSSSYCIDSCPAVLNLVSFVSSPVELAQEFQEKQKFDRFDSGLRSNSVSGITKAWENIGLCDANRVGNRLVSWSSLGKKLEIFYVQGFQRSSSARFSTAASDISVEKSPGDESVNDSGSEQKLLGDRTLKLLSGSFYLPHPEKEETGGEDAHFICADEQAIGIADGVGGWADLGINAGQYAKELMSNCVAAIQEEPKGSIDPARILEKAYLKTKAKGSSTACIVALTNGVLHAVNLGDSGFLVIRDGSTMFRSPVQQHDFNFTYQLESGNRSDLPSAAQVFTFPVSPGDVIVAGTDGIFDNLYNNEISGIVVHAIRTGLESNATAQKIAALARQRAQDKNRQTPFSAAAQEAGFRYYGGKLDDISVVVSYVTAS